MSERMIISWNDVVHQAKISCLAPSLFEGIVSRRIIADTAKAKGIEVDVAELQLAADKFRVARGLLNASDTWLWLQKHSLSIDEFEEMVHTSALSLKLAEQLFGNRVEAVFIENQLQYQQAAIYEMILEDEDVAMELFYAIKEGESSFYELAYHYIDEPELRRVRGYRGVLNRTDLRPEVSAAVFSSAPPQILKPIITSQGVHLIWVEELLQPELDEALRSKILLELFSQWLKQRVEQVEIAIESSPAIEQNSPSPTDSATMVNSH